MNESLLGKASLENQALPYFWPAIHPYKLISLPQLFGATESHLKSPSSMYIIHIYQGLSQKTALITPQTLPYYWLAHTQAATCPRRPGVPIKLVWWRDQLVLVVNVHLLEKRDRLLKGKPIRYGISQWNFHFLHVHCSTKHVFSILTMQPSFSEV